jgi:isochorismate synthase EntC
MHIWFAEPESYFIRVTSAGVERHFSEQIMLKPSSFEGYTQPVTAMPDWWAANVEHTKQQIVSGELTKKVLYHDITFEAAHPGHFIQSKKGDGRFLIMLDETTMMYGISPECTIHKVDDVVSIEVLGGTSPQLLDSRGEPYQKYKDEHDIIIHDLLKRNDALTWKKKYQIKDLGYTQHLRSILQYSTQESLEDIVSRVYPNYAIDGDGINDWWGTLVGWHNAQHNQTKLWLAIRCGIYDMKTNTHTVRTGVGITKDSDAQQEWLELHQKLGWLA